MLQPGRSYTNGSEYRYGFNGKENDNEVKGEGNQQDYGLRIYDPRLARFLSDDPLTKDYPFYTPYSFAGNKPLQFIDLDGGEEKEVVEKSTAPVLRAITKETVVAKVVPITTKGVALKVATRFNIFTALLSLFSLEGGKYIPPNGYGPIKPNPTPTPTTTPQPNTQPQPASGDDGGNKPKLFHATYTKTNPETGQTYAGRTSGVCQCPNGSEPTRAEAELAVQGRENTHLILNEEGFDKAILDKASTNKPAIRGREQDLVDAAGGAQKVDGGTARNKIRAVSRKKAPYYQGVSQATYGKLPNNNPADKLKN